MSGVERFLCCREETLFTERDYCYTKDSKRQEGGGGERNRERESKTKWNTMNYVELVKPWKLITNKDDEVC